MIVDSCRASHPSPRTASCLCTRRNRQLVIHRGEALVKPVIGDVCALLPCRVCIMKGRSTVEQIYWRAQSRRGQAARRRREYLLGFEVWSGYTISTSASLHTAWYRCRRLVGIWGHLTHLQDHLDGLFALGHQACLGLWTVQGSEAKAACASPSSGHQECHARRMTVQTHTHPSRLQGSVPWV